MTTPAYEVAAADQAVLAAQLKLADACARADTARKALAQALDAAEPQRPKIYRDPGQTVMDAPEQPDGGWMPGPRPARDQAAAAISYLMRALVAEDDEHTADTPMRAARAWQHMLSGYQIDPARHLRTTFPNPNPADHAVRAPVFESGLRVRSTCAHHLLPFLGTATVAYQPKPGAPIVGLSKLARLVDGYARRLQTQERLTAQIAQALHISLSASWVSVMITAEHHCMTLRGVEEPAAATTTRVELGDITDRDAALVLQTHHDGGRR